jgi:NADH-quinone oxidoreductase subunit M
MNVALLGVFSYSYVGISGGICLLISHGWVSSALFFLVGCLYERYRTRVLLYYSGLVNFMPLFSVFFFIFNLANMGFPGSSGFLGELLIFFSFVEC